MLEIKSIDELARRLHEIIPPGVRDASGDLQKHIRATLQTGLGKLDLVTREEFDVQRKVLERTREKIDALEAKLAAMTPTSGGTASPLSDSDPGA